MIYKEEYEPIHGYRVIEREDGDDHPVDHLDFRSYFELKKKPKNPRGVSSNYMSNPHYYGVSSFKSRAMVEQKRLREGGGVLWFGAKRGYEAYVGRKHGK